MTSRRFFYSLSSAVRRRRSSVVLPPHPKPAHERHHALPILHRRPFAAGHMFDPAAPPRTGRLPLPPQTNDEGARGRGQG